MSTDWTFTDTQGISLKIYFSSCYSTVQSNTTSKLFVSCARQSVACSSRYEFLLNSAQNAFIMLLMGPLIKMFRDEDSGLIEMPACSYLQCK
jgi:hypothetical protein